MSYLIEAKNEIEGLSKLLRLIIERGKKNGNYLEILSCLLTISYDKVGLEKFRNFEDRFLRVAGKYGGDGWNRATKVYTTTKDKPTKPSYLKRLVKYPDSPRKYRDSMSSINQIDTIINELVKKPGISILSFVFLRPADLVDKFRPGYVPCPIAGDFKFRDGKLHLSVIFRTSDAFGVGYADIIYLRDIQEHVLEEAKSKSANEQFQHGCLGNLNLYFSRTYIQRRYRLREQKLKVGKSIDTLPLIEALIAELDKIN